MDISFGDQKVRINIFNTSKYTQEEEDYFVIDQIDEIAKSNSSLDLLQDDVLDEPIEKTQIQEVNALLDSPHSSHSLSWSVKVEPLSE